MSMVVEKKSTKPLEVTTQPSSETLQTEESKLGGRRRNRKKNKQDPQDIMNQFIHKLAAKKEEKPRNRGQANDNQAKKDNGQKKPMSNL